MDSKLSKLLPLLMACILIVFVLAMSSEAPRYSSFVSDTELTDGEDYRLEGSVAHVMLNDARYRFELCDKSVCVPAEASAHLKVLGDTRVIVEGKYQNGVLSVSKILTRCDHHRK